MRRIQGAVMALALFGAAGCGDAGGDAAAAPDVATHRVKRLDLRVTVDEKGTLKASNEILIRAEIPGQAKIMAIIDEGAVVKQGDVLCELDPTDVDKELAQLQDRLIQLQAEVKAADAELAIQLSQNEADIADAKLKHHFAEVELRRYQEGEFVQEEKKRTIRVEEARSSLERAEKKYEQMPALKEEGFVTETQVEEERINLVKARSELELAELDLATYMGLTSPKELAQKQADVRNAALEVDRTQKRAEAREAQKASALDRQRREQANVQERFKTANETRANMVIRAPASGIVVYGNTPWDDREIKVGETVYSGHPFMSLPDLSAMQVIVSIHEADISKVKPGQKANVNVETATGRTLEGVVAKVAPVASNQGGRRWYDDTKRFQVDITLSGDIEGMELKPGLTAKVSILVDELSNALAVPAQSVFAESGKFYVFRREAGVAKRAEVSIEEGNSQYVMVKSGLAEGDEILLYNPETVSEGIPAAPGAGAAARPAGRTNGGERGNGRP